MFGKLCTRVLVGEKSVLKYLVDKQPERAATKYYLRQCQPYKDQIAMRVNDCTIRRFPMDYQS